MADENYETSLDGRVPVYSWTRGVPYEPSARIQVGQTALLPIIWPHVAVMPDVHLGTGATVGSVIPTRRAIIPGSVGVDLGCGMCAVQTSLTSHDLGDNAQSLFESISKTVPHGNASDGQYSNIPNDTSKSFAAMEPGLKRILGRHRGIEQRTAHEQLGTLGGGNHFIEICIDKIDRVWVMLHSGSRGVGNRIGSHFIKLAKKEMERLDRKLPNKDLAYLEEGTEHFAEYVEAVAWAQNYAKENRRLMLAATIAAMKNLLDTQFTCSDAVVDCHHNYVEREIHFGEQLWVTRKGAVSARIGEMGIIPSSMGTRSFIVRGKGNPMSFNSCSHGAGRVMARGRAKKEITLEQHIADTAGVACRKDSSVVDESPTAYKDIDAVMAAQSDLVEIVHELKQVVCVKG